jgi:hypothetical protein
MPSRDALSRESIKGWQMYRLRDDDLRSVNARHTILTVLDYNELFASPAGIEPRFYG